MSESRKDVLMSALEAEVGGESADLGSIFTDDVVGWSPIATVSAGSVCQPKHRSMRRTKAAASTPSRAA